MTIGRTRAIALNGLTGSMVEVEADLSNHLPAFVLIGLPDAALSEAHHRVIAGASNAGCPFPRRKITVNLSPAALPKHGSAFDLAIAMAVLAADNRVSAKSVDRVVHIGELGLDGRLRPTSGVLPAVLGAHRAGYDTVMVPHSNAGEASLVRGVTVIGVASLRDAAIWHGGKYSPLPITPVPNPDVFSPDEAFFELAEVIGNDDAVDGLLIAAVGKHHMFMVGPPGSGKTMLASRLPGILPDLTETEALEVSCVQSISGFTLNHKLTTRPPWENPHHTATAASMVGGGSGRIRPGSAARASHGVLFLDEAPEFSTAVLNSLRQPLESGEITIHRANAVAQFPARFQLILAANPCPCGYYGKPDSPCSCPPNSRRRYLARVSGPLMDRIDIRLRVARITDAYLRSIDNAVTRRTTVKAREQVSHARLCAAERLVNTPWSSNSEVPGSWLRSHNMRLPRTDTAILDRALERGDITMRGYDRVLRVAWSIADIEGLNRPRSEQIGRALFLRKGIT